MSNFEVQQSTETVYRYHCLTCDGVGSYSFSFEGAQTLGLVHERHLCPGRPKKQPKVKKGDVL